MAQGFKRVLNCEKLKAEQVKKEVERNREKREERFGRAQENHKHLKAQAREKYAYLNQKDQERTRLISEIKDAIAEDID